jgi:hypothetical protein
MKTVLAPNAPWPTTSKDKPKPAPRKRAPAKPKKRSVMQKTDEMFKAWEKKTFGDVQ